MAPRKKSYKIMRFWRSLFRGVDSASVLVCMSAWHGWHGSINAGSSVRALVMSLSLRRRSLCRSVNPALDGSGSLFTTGQTYWPSYISLAAEVVQVPYNHPAYRVYVWRRRSANHLVDPISKVRLGTYTRICYLCKRTAGVNRVGL